MNCEFMVFRNETDSKKFWIVSADKIITLRRGVDFFASHQPDAAERISQRKEVSPQEVLDELGVSPQDLLDWTTSGKPL